MLYISYTGCQWRVLPEEFGLWTRVWSQCRRWSMNANVDSGSWNGTRRRALLVAEKTRDPHWWSSTRTSRAEPRTGVSSSTTRAAPTDPPTAPHASSAWTSRVLALRVRVVPASTSGASAVEQILDDLARTGDAEHLELVLVDRGTTASGATRFSAKFNYEVRRVGRDEPPRDEHGAKVFRPLRHAWRVEVAHGHLVRRRRLARCFENPTACATGWSHVASLVKNLRSSSRVVP